jgi:peptidoglycan/LPS O-acetylase OafA/YrhL
MRGRLGALTGLRFFAALWVVLLHCQCTAFRHLPAWCERIRGRGFVAVSLFFVLSGFILTIKYASANRETDFRASSFWMARFARIYPVYVLALLLAAPLVFHQGTVTGRMGSGVANLGLVQAWLPRTVGRWNLPGWSVSAEAFFYLSFPLIITIIGPAAGRSRLTACLCIGALWLVTLLPPLLVRCWNPHDAQFWSTFLRFGPLIRLPEFLIGVVFGRLFVADVQQRKKISGTSWSTLAAVAIVLLLARRQAIPLFPTASVLSPLFGLLVCGLAHGGGVLQRALATRSLVYAGEVSYAFYILQKPVLEWLRRLNAWPTTLSGRMLLIYLVSLGLVSVLVFHFVEQPARTWLRSLRLRPRGARVREGNMGFRRNAPTITTWVSLSCWFWVVLGLALRLRDVAINRSLWVDEAMLALNIVSRSCAGLLRPLDYNQGAPLGFLLIERVFARSFGTSEMVLRVLPFLAGAASIFLLWWVARRLLAPSMVPIAVALFALCDMLVYYSAELKPYSLDVAVSLGIVAATILYLEDPRSRGRLFILAATGAAAPWLSLPAIFTVMSALVAVTMASRGAPDPKPKRGLLCAIWGASSLVCFLVFDRQLLHKTHEDYWQVGFMPVGTSALPWLADRLAELMHHQAGLRIAWLGWPIAGIGALALARRNRPHAALLVGPIILCLAAAAFHLYAFQHRLILFLAPFPILLVAEGVSRIPTRHHLRLGAAVAILWAPVAFAAHRWTAPHHVEEIKPALAYLAASSQPGDRLYIGYATVPAFRYYWPRVRHPDLEPETLPGDEDAATRVRGHRVWILSSHVSTNNPHYVENIRRALDARGHLIAALKPPGVTLLLYELDHDQLAATTPAQPKCDRGGCERRSPDNTF